MKVTIDKGVNYRCFLPDQDLYSASGFLEIPERYLQMFFNGYGLTEELAIEDLKRNIKEYREAEYPKTIEVEI